MCKCLSLGACLLTCEQVILKQTHALLPGDWEVCGEMDLDTPGGVGAGGECSLRRVAEGSPGSGLWVLPPWEASGTFLGAVHLNLERC